MALQSTVWLSYTYLAEGSSGQRGGRASTRGHWTPAPKILLSSFIVENLKDNVVANALYSLSKSCHIIVTCFISFLRLSS